MTGASVGTSVLVVGYSLTGEAVTGASVGTSVLVVG